jgi:hypothetical protein
VSAGQGGGEVIMAYTNEVDERQPLEIGGSPRSTSLVRLIVAVLLEMGGSAHRDAVIDRIALRQGAARASESLTQDVVCAFERHRARARRRKEAPLVYLPFGEGSRRWGVVSQPLAAAVAPGAVIDRPTGGFADNEGAGASAAIGQVSPTALDFARSEAMSDS